MKESLPLNNNRFAKMSRAEILADHHEFLCKISGGLCALKELNKNSLAKLRTDFIQTDESTIEEYLTVNRVFSDKVNEETTLSYDEAIEIVESRLRILENFVFEIIYAEAGKRGGYWSGGYLPYCTNVFETHLEEFGITGRHAHFIQKLGLTVSSRLVSKLYAYAKRLDEEAVDKLKAINKKYADGGYDSKDDYLNEYDSVMDEWCGNIDVCVKTGCIAKHYTKKYLEEIGHYNWCHIMSSDYLEGALDDKEYSQIRRKIVEKHIMDRKKHKKAF